jgi:hypothetical protein
MKDLTMTKHKLLKELSHTLWDSDLLVSRITLAIAEFSWAVLLLWPGDTFERKIYSTMALFTNEEVWGFIFLASAVIQVYIVLSGNIHSKLSELFAGWNALFWIAAMVSLLLSMKHPASATLSGNIAVSFVAVWIWIRPYILKRGYKRAGY